MNTKELEMIIFYFSPPNKLFRYNAALLSFPIRHTFVSLAPLSHLPRKMYGTISLAGGKQLMQVVHIGDLARGYAATARLRVFSNPHASADHTITIRLQ